MKFIIITIFTSILLISCENDLNQFPPLEAESNSLTSFGGVLNAAYYYHQASTTPLAIMGDFRADNMLMKEEPFPAFDRYNKDLAGGDLVEQFFRPFYKNLYKSILSSNNVIENSSNPTEIGEAKFLRALSYFKLVMVFGDVPVNLSAAPSVTDKSVLARKPVSSIYQDIIISDLKDAISLLGNSRIKAGRASKLAAQGMLGKVYMHLRDYNMAVTELGNVVNSATAAGVTLKAKFADVFGEANDLNSEILFATQLSTSIEDEYGFTTFTGWFKGADTKSPQPLDPDLTAAFEESEASGGGTDLRKVLTIDPANMKGLKWGGLNQDWIELRLADIILLYGEALNETGKSDEALVELNKIRNRAGLNDSNANTQQTIRKAFANERRLELALEGHRWFDLVRTGTVSEEMGVNVDAQYFIFPIPNSEILASGGVITQNPGYN